MAEKQKTVETPKKFVEEIPKKFVEETPKKFVEPLITVPKPRANHHHHQSPYRHPTQTQSQPQSQPNSNGMSPGSYAELLQVIAELGHHVRPSYAGHRASSEKMRQGIMKARILVKECLIETEKSARQ